MSEPLSQAKLVLDTLSIHKALFVRASQQEHQRLEAWVNCALLEYLEHERYETLFESLIEYMGGRPDWADGLSVRATYWLLTLNLTPHKVAQLVEQGGNLREALKGAPLKTVNEIKEYLEDSAH